jgi:hypothetical protein
MPALGAANHYVHLCYLKAVLLSDQAVATPPQLLCWVVAGLLHWTVVKECEMGVD